MSHSFLHFIRHSSAQNLYLGLALIGIGANTASAEEGSLSEISSNPLESALMQSIKTPELRCGLSYLESLGWRVVPSASGRVEVIDGNPCNRSSLKESQSKGELTIGLPAQPTAQDLNQVVTLLEGLMKNSATVCAYKLKVADAAIKGIRSLQKNADYRFTGHLWQGHIQTGFVDLGFFSDLRMGWKPLEGTRSGMGYTPDGSNSRAIESFFTSTARTECAAGLQLSEFTIQYELYGHDDFERAFNNNEIVIGTWWTASHSLSAIHGRHAGQTFEDPMGVHSAILGGKALVGRTGYLGNVKGEAFLDDKDDRGENLLIVSITPEASADIATSNGLQKYNNQFQKVWELHTQNKSLIAESAKKNKTVIAANNAAITAIYQTPFFRGIATYTHPFKRLKNFRDHAERLWRMNPRTPYALKLYSDVINGGLFDRHQRYFVNQCLGKK